MLEELKGQLHRDETSAIVMEAAQNQDIRDIFLDNLDLETVTMGAENDPEITAIIAKIPMYEEFDKDFAKEIDSIAESAMLLPE